MGVTFTTIIIICTTVVIVVHTTVAFEHTEDADTEETLRVNT